MKSQLMASMLDGTCIVFHYTGPHKPRTTLSTGWKCWLQQSALCTIWSQSTLAWKLYLTDYLISQSTVIVNQVNLYLQSRSKTGGPASRSNFWTQLAEEATSFKKERKRNRKLSHTSHVRSGHMYAHKKKIKFRWLLLQHTAECIITATTTLHVSTFIYRHYTMYNSHWANFDIFFSLFFSFCFLNSKETALTVPNLRVTMHSTPLLLPHYPRHAVLCGLHRCSTQIPPHC